MPPSGYTARQSETIADFLKSCARALEEEAATLGEGYQQALSRECRGIDSALADSQARTAAEAVLDLTRCFYASVLRQGPTTSEGFWQSVERALVEVRGQILAVHVDT